MWLPSAVWLKTTSRITSIPALCSALTMSRNSVICEPCVGVDAVARLRREVEVGVVAPEVPQLRAVDRVDAAHLALVEGEHRQQLDRGDAELLEVGDLLDHAGERARVLDARGRRHREAAHVAARRRSSRSSAAAAARRPPSRSRGRRRSRRASTTRGCRRAGTRRPASRACSCCPSRTGRAAPSRVEAVAVAGRARGRGRRSGSRRSRPRTYMCQKWKLRLTTGSNGIVATGCTSSCASKSSSSTPVASSEKREKLTPPSSTVAPSGWGRPRSKVGRRSTIERRRGLSRPRSPG